MFDYVLEKNLLQQSATGSLSETPKRRLIHIRVLSMRAHIEQSTTPPIFRSAHGRSNPSPTVFMFALT